MALGDKAKNTAEMAREKVLDAVHSVEHKGQK